MRRSKSNPAKYAKNYRSISQRKMTEHDEEDDEKEMERLRQILRESFVAQTCQEANDDTLVEKSRKKRQRTKGAKDLEEPPLGAASHGSPTVDPDDAEGPVEAAAAATHGILSAEIMKEYESDEMVLLESKKKKSGSKKVAVLLTPAELKQAAALQKKTARKLKQLEDRAAGKQKRAALYASLQQTALSNDAMRLLSRTADLGKHVTKREQLQQLLRKERAGMALSETEQDILYQWSDVKDYFEDKKDNIISAAAVTSSTIPPNDNAIHSRDESKPPSTGQKHKKQKLDTDDKSSSTQPTGARTHHVGDTAEQSTQETATDEDEAVNMTTDSSVAVVSESTTTAAVMPASGLSLAAQMMASLTTLKKESTVQAAQTAKEREEAELRRMKEEEKKHQPTQGYVPSKPIEIKTTQSYSKIEPKIQQLPFAKGIFREVQRPPDVAAVRYDLPVAAMEFEVMDAINNNDVTILCSETGSGKSTQVPQFLYEAGLSRCAASEGEAGTTAACIIGVTQPRRVAAVSTAKRVCYEMGQGNGQTILRRGPNKGDGNLVAYQTRYETAGLGRQTHIKFMTDGILLQEIQTDLLLRKYSVIVLDEAHERNLNTDVLIGLISVALPLRKQAAKESGLPPLKIVIMSATLRVEDFTGNKSLFSSTVPAVVTVPGRTHPVTIHHSKVTELDDYGKFDNNSLFSVERTAR
jgi:DEAD/DEAH box helicase